MGYWIKGHANIKHILQTTQCKCFATNHDQIQSLKINLIYFLTLWLDYNMKHDFKVFWNILVVAFMRNFLYYNQFSLKFTFHFWCFPKENLNEQIFHGLQSLKISYKYPKCYFIIKWLLHLTLEPISPGASKQLYPSTKIIFLRVINSFAL